MVTISRQIERPLAAQPARDACRRGGLLGLRRHASNGIRTGPETAKRAGTWPARFTCWSDLRPRRPPAAARASAPRPCRRTRRRRRASWSRRTGRRRRAPGRASARSRPPVQWPISTVATELPAKFVSARASDMNRSMPTIRPTPSTSSGRCELQAAGQGGHAGAGDAGGALRGDDHEQQQRDLLADATAGRPAPRR